jgi:hypothetical protein
MRLISESANVWALPVGIYGMSLLLDRHRRLRWATLSCFVLYSLYAVLFDTTDSYVYLMPAVAVFMLWVAEGLRRILEQAWSLVEARRKPSWVIKTLVALVLLVSVVGVPLRWATLNLRGDTEAMDYASEALAHTAPDALIVVEGDAHTFSLWYARYGLGQRADVAVVNDALLAFEWYRVIVRKYHPQVMGSGHEVVDLLSLLAANAGQRPIYFSDRPASLPAGYRTERSGDLRRLVPG